MAVLEGTLANDTLMGTGGDDVIRGSGGADVIDGGDGVDTFEAGPYGFQSGFTWANRTEQGGEAQTGDAASGASWRLTFRNIERVVGSDGDDRISLLGYSPTILGGAGNDIIGSVMNGGTTYLRGDGGDDVIYGGDAFNDLNGNRGNDTVHGGFSGDWVLGGQDNDILYGHEDADILNGNLGDDTADGGRGADVVRGGQGSDSLIGGAGHDWLSGDRGDDTVTGGEGADVFHSFAGAGLDRITDFQRAQGDRVTLDVGTTYEARQAGADVVIDLGDGSQVVLAGVPLSELTGDWIGVG